MLQSSLLTALALVQASDLVLPPIYGVARSIDGDSLMVAQTSIRLYGIDAPEFDQICTRGGARWACGTEAAERLSRLVTGKDVTCVPVGRDQYQRLLARCSLLGTDVNRTMVQTGYAIAYRRYSSDYVSAEEQAKAAKRGIWAGEFEMPDAVRAQAWAEPKGATDGSRSTRAKVRTVSGVAKGCVIKGNRSRRGEWIYHLPGMPYYAQTRAEDVFCTEREARAAGYRRAIVR